MKPWQCQCIIYWDGVVLTVDVWRPALTSRVGYRTRAELYIVHIHAINVPIPAKHKHIHTTLHLTLDIIPQMTPHITTHCALFALSWLNKYYAFFLGWGHSYCTQCRESPVLFRMIYDTICLGLIFFLSIKVVEYHFRLQISFTCIKKNVRKNSHTQRLIT